MDPGKARHRLQIKIVAAWDMAWEVSIAKQLVDSLQGDDVKVVSHRELLGIDCRS